MDYPNVYSSLGNASQAQNGGDAMDQASSTPSFINFVYNTFPNLVPTPPPAGQAPPALPAPSAASAAQQASTVPAQSQRPLPPAHATSHGGAHSPRANQSPPAGSAWTENEWQKVYSTTPDGVAELRARWEADLKHTQMPPPPPQVYSTKQDGIEAVKSFAKENGYVLVVGHSYKDKYAANNETNRVLLTCELGGYFRDHFKKNPEARVRNRMSRKTGCPMKILISKRRLTDEWVTIIKEHRHNHGPFKDKAVVTPSKIPDLENALHEWHMAELARGESVHGNTLKARALALYAEMPQYRGQPPPALDKDWLDQYRLRFHLPGKVSRPRVRAFSEDGTVPDTAEEAVSVEPPAFTNLEGVFPPDQKLFHPTKQFVQEYMSRYDASHDFKHVTRVFGLARRILQQEMQMFQGPSYDPQAVLLAALLHDVGDHKYTQPGENAENQIAEHLLEHGASAELAMKIQLIAKNVSFSNEMKNPRMMKAVLEQHPELAIVQDADRLDAIGAVGIGRCFAFGGAKKPDRDLGGAIEHFTEKLERLETMMKTETGRRMARERTQRLQVFRQWWDEENNMLV